MGDMDQRPEGSPLDEYQRKRDFAQTPEPEGRPEGGGGIFVVQLHAASHLHYDFRLEMDGVLKSWAVPKGPSFDPSLKRLAMHVEDHPLAYAGFEGIIPKGQYGGGTVMIWDSGYWVPDGDPHYAYRKGTIKFTLVGSKLHGRWVLVREKQPRQEGKEGWLLIKERDDFADGRDILLMAMSSATGRTLDEIAAGKDAVWTPVAGAGNPDRLFPPGISGAERAPMPDSIAPQLATLVREVPDGDDWINEIKYDGYRLLIRIADGTATIFTRRGRDWTTRFPALASAAVNLPVTQAWLDGEAVITEASGITNFQSLQTALASGDTTGALYFAFDLLYLNGFDLRHLPLGKRKELLRAVVGGTADTILYSDHVSGNAALLYRSGCAHQVEGIISKRRDSAYVSGRTRMWLKVKCRNRQEFVICGYTDATGGRQGFGALVIGTHDAGGNLVYAGKVGTGFTDETLVMLYSRLLEISVATASIANMPDDRETRRVHWVRPELVAEVEFTEMTRDGVLRHPSFQGLREDRSADEVVLETPAVLVPEDPDGVAGLEAEVPMVAKDVPARLTNPDKILYPGVTKQDLAGYYTSIFRRMIRHLEDRPLTLVRCPEGWNGECFFQKHAYENVPPSVRRISIIEDGGASAVYLAVDSMDGLLGLVQMGILEIHTWGSRSRKLEYPDRLVFDLDPDEGLPWERLAEAALLVRNRLLDHRLESFIKTTGGKGFHVVVPVNPDRTWEEVKEFARLFAERLSRDYSDRFTPKMAKEVRTGRVFLDWMRNIRGATAVEVFSTRKKESAALSVPVHWEEVVNGIKPDEFTLANIRDRFAGLLHDPWEAYFKISQSLPDIR